MRRLAALSIAVLISVFLDTASAEPATLRIGISSDNPPWSFVPERLPAVLAGQAALPPVTPAQFKTLTGLDVEVAQALAQQMSVSAKLAPANWLNIEKELLEGRFDVILSSWTPSRKTPPAVVASDSYLSWGLVIAVRAGASVRSLADLPAAGSVGHYTDPAVEQTLRSLGSVRTKSYDSEGALFRDLREGKVDAVVHDSTYARWRVNAEPTIRIVGEPLNKLGYHVGVRRADKELLAKIQEGVKRLVSSPEMTRIKAKWEAFGKP